MLPGDDLLDFRVQFLDVDDLPRVLGLDVGADGEVVVLLRDGVGGDDADAVVDGLPLGYLAPVDLGILMASPEDRAVDYVSATCVRIPVFVGHAEAVHAEFERPISVEEARQLLSVFPGIALIDEYRPGGYATPLDCEGNDPVYVSRLRRDPSVPNGLSFWVVADNIRKGAALNAVQMAEALALRNTIRPRR